MRGGAGCSCRTSPTSRFRTKARCGTSTSDAAAGRAARRPVVHAPDPRERPRAFQGHRPGRPRRSDLHLGDDREPARGGPHAGVARRRARPLPHPPAPRPRRRRAHRPAHARPPDADRGRPLVDAAAVLPARRLRPADAGRGATHTFCVPVHLAEILDAVPELPPSVRHVLLGAAPAPAPILRRAIAAAPSAESLSVYAMTEILPVAIASAKEKLAHTASGDFWAHPYQAWAHA